MKQNEETKDFYLLLFQSEISNLISSKDLSKEILSSLIDGAGDVVLNNKEFMDLYLCENLFSTLLPGLESLSKNVERLMLYSGRHDDNEVERFNPCNYLAEFLMRNNPRYGKNQEIHDKFLKFTRKERKSRMIEKSKEKLFEKAIRFYRSKKIKINKLNIIRFIKELDESVSLKNLLHKYDWIEHFRVYKDEQEISLESFLEAFYKAILDIHEIDEGLLSNLLK